VSRASCLTLAALVLACRGDSRDSSDTTLGTLAPIGSGTELLLTRERLSLIDGWIRATAARTGRAPQSLGEVRPPEEDAPRYAPLERFLRDGWGREIEYEYAPATRSYELRSPGPDGTPRTVDDVTVRRPL
jgi:Type II secretion system (T2SS), protein G